MKRRLLAATVAIFAMCGVALAQMPGKVYSPGDTIMIKGVEMMVFSVNEDGSHGKAMLTPTPNQEMLDKTAATANKIMDKYKGKTQREVIEDSKRQLLDLVKKRVMTQKQVDDAIAQMDKALQSDGVDPDAKMEDIDTASVSAYNIKPVKYTKEGGKRVYDVIGWAASHPAEWRLANNRDAKQLIGAITGGLGMEHSYGLKDKQAMAEKFTKGNFKWSNLVIGVLSSGMIVCDNMHLNDVIYVRELTQTISMKHWMEFMETYAGGEYTVAVTDF